jgi:hypothetical protein
MRDLLVEPSRNHELHDLALTGRQPIEALTKFSDFGTFRASFAIIFQGLPDCVHQLVYSYRLRQEMNRPGLQGMHGHGNVAVAGKKNDRQRNASAIHLALQIQSVHFGHLHIQDQAALGLDRPMSKKFHRRPECLHWQAERFDQAGQPFPH